MAKAKSFKVTKKDPNKALHSRISYLYQAATYLATQQRHSSSTTLPDAEKSPKSDNPFQPASRHLVSDLRSVALKGQNRLSPTMKHCICKNCNTLLIDGSTCSNEVENKSKGGKKPWADMLVRTCNTCGMERRFPLAAERQKRRPHREKQLEATSKLIPG